MVSQVRQLVYRPGGSLRRYVREILWVRSERPRTQILLPETTFTLVLRQSGLASLDNHALPNAIVSGLQQRTRRIEHSSHATLMIVRFTEVGAAAIVHDRVDLLYNRTIPLDSVLPPREIDHIQNVLADTRSIPRQFVALEPFSTVESSHKTSPRALRQR
jgi:hypothetical protein